jgi:hypothetical protein
MTLTVRAATYETRGQREAVTVKSVRRERLRKAQALRFFYCQFKARQHRLREDDSARRGEIDMLACERLLPCFGGLQVDGRLLKLIFQSAAGA